MGRPILQISNLDVRYGQVRAVSGVSVELCSGEVRVILGANGAGKSSIIRSIMGLARPFAGRIEFPPGVQIQRLPAHSINARGIAWVPEGRQVFATLNVAENLLLGGFRERNGDALAHRLNEIYDLFPVLRDRRSQLASSLSGGEQQMLAIGRALMSNPTLLLMDEPSLGLAPKIVRQLFDLVMAIRAKGTAILMAEQNARQALRVADYAYLLEIGRVRIEGPATQLAGDDHVRRAYLGG